MSEVDGVWFYDKFELGQGNAFKGKGDCTKCAVLNQLFDRLFDDDEYSNQVT